MSLWPVIGGGGSLHQSGCEFDRLDDVLAALLDVVVRADGHGFDLPLRPDDMLQGRAKFDGKPPALCSLLLFVVVIVQRWREPLVFLNVLVVL